MAVKEQELQDFDAVKIVSIREEGFKRINAFEFKFGPDGILEIVGDNAQGKSSIIDGIYAALCGGRAIPEKPLKTGARKGSVAVELDNGLTVERTFTKSGSTLKVTCGGAEQKSPQKILDQLYGMGFNISEFLRDAKKQREILLSVCDLKPDWKGWPEADKPSEFDVGDDPLAWIDARYKALYEERTEANKESKKLQGAYDAARAEIPRGQENQKPASATALMAERDKLVAANQIYHARMDQIANLEEKAAAKDQEINDLQARLEAAQVKRSEIKAALAELQAAHELSAGVADLSAINAKIATVDETNRIAAKCERLDEAEKAKRAAEKIAEDLDFTIKDIEDFKKQLLSTANFPLDGLGIEFDCVTWRGEPLSQASHSEGLEVAIAVALKLNPKLRLIVMDDAEKFGDAALKRIIDMLQDNNFQGIIARVGSDTKTPNGVIIEEGEIAI